VARKFTIFNPLLCLQDSISLNKEAAVNSFNLIATCSNSKHANISSKLSIVITGTNGEFELTDTNGYPISDITSIDGNLTVGPLSKILTVDEENDFTKTCEHITLIPKTVAQATTQNQPVCPACPTAGTGMSYPPMPIQNEHYTLQANCKNNSGTMSVSTLDLRLKNKNENFIVSDVSGKICSKIKNIQGVLACVD
jgi:hypothetical protein